VKKLSVVALAVALLVGVSAGPAAATGNWSYWQQTIDYSSFFQARARSHISVGSDEVVAGIFWSGNYTEGRCTSSSHSCYDATSPYFTYEFPTTVYTMHSYCVDNPYPLCSDGATNNLSVYYP